MIFDWDAANVEYITRHGVTLRECEEAYTNGPDVIEHQRRKHERRRLCLDDTNRGRLLTFVVMERKGKTRLITAYPMPAKSPGDLPREGIMATKTRIPAFKAEKEETAWWDAHPDVVTELFLKAKKENYAASRLPRRDEAGDDPHARR